MDDKGRDRAKRQSDIERVGDDRQAFARDEVVGDLRCRRTCVDDDRLVIMNKRRRDFSDLPLLIHIGEMLQRQGLNLLWYGFEIGAAMVAGDEAFLVEALEVLADRHFGDAEGHAEIANAGASLLLQPFEYFHTTRLGEQRAALLTRRYSAAAGRAAFVLRRP